MHNRYINSCIVRGHVSIWTHHIYIFPWLWSSTSKILKYSIHSVYIYIYIYGTASSTICKCYNYIISGTNSFRHYIDIYIYIYSYSISLLSLLVCVAINSQLHQVCWIIIKTNQYHKNWSHLFLQSHFYTSAHAINCWVRFNTDVSYAKCLKELFSLCQRYHDLCHL